jgi:hypothetical protein
MASGAENRRLVTPPVVLAAATLATARSHHSARLVGVEALAAQGPGEGPLVRDDVKDLLAERGRAVRLQVQSGLTPKCPDS